MMRCLLVLSVVCALSPRAFADAPDAKTEAAAGQRLYEDGQYHDAGVKFAHAYELDPQIAYLFDAGQAFRFAKECSTSAKYYRQFLDTAKQVQNVDKVKKYLAEMDECAKQRTQTLEPPKPEPPKLQQQPEQQPAPAPETPSADPGATKRKAGLALGAVGLVGIGIGIVYTGKVFSDQRDCSPTHTCTLDQINQSNRDGPSDEHIEIAAYAVGAGALAGGVLLYMLGRGESVEHGVTLAPTRHGAMLSFTF